MKTTEFTKFLKKHGVYREFVKLIKRDYTGSSLEHYCKRIVSGEDTYISGSFGWESSNKKSFDFWSDLDKKWRATL